MSDFDVYEDEMFNRGYTERDIDVLLSGGVPNDPGLARLTPVVDRLKAHIPLDFDSTRMATFTAQAVKTVPKSILVVPTSVARPTGFSRRLAFAPRFVGALAAIALLVGMSGIAVASNEAAPGDTLYGLDRALERVGVGVGGAEERLAEATVLIGQGRAADALDHAVEAIDVANEVASVALQEAAERVGGMSSENGNAADVQANVAAMLDWMTTTKATGSDFDQGVAERARQISGPNTAANDSSTDGAKGGPPEDVPAGPPDHAPGGPPESIPSRP